VHGVTGPAASALLKGLEEPPAHVRFLLCTDQPEKLSGPILGRCEKIVLRPTSPGDLMPLMKRIAKKEKLPFKKKVLRKIAELGAGQPRESVQLLQTVTNIRAGQPDLSLNEVLTLAVKSAGSIATDKVAVKLILSLYTRKLNGALAAIYDTDDYFALINKAMEIHRHILDLCLDRFNYESYFRKVLVVNLKKIRPSMPSIVEALAVHEALVMLKGRLGNFIIQDFHNISAGIYAILRDAGIPEQYSKPGKIDKDEDKDEDEDDDDDE
jgi:hypothetical protein